MRATARAPVFKPRSPRSEWCLFCGNSWAFSLGPLREFLLPKPWGCSWSLCKAQTRRCRQPSAFCTDSSTVARHRRQVHPLTQSLHFPLRLWWLREVAQSHRRFGQWFEACQRFSHPWLSTGCYTFVLVASSSCPLSSCWPSQWLEQSWLGLLVLQC